MSARVVECNQDGALVGMETAAGYAEMAEGLMVQYRGFLKHLKTLDVGGRYLEIGPGPGVEMREMLQGLGIERYEIKNVFPFMRSVLIER